eukprot:CAMPEP_0173095572 /NCGR_PEP_ID=MMETSP1102-20130122/32063_1 /TAXON_ID=49646 /ORGANISM="Geminigera sp., Strain Caron Lab Isolate" /LENGTH=863 /DNA_ID=CAMNT_0013985599 /DNA_START=52 /DNA_END=2643 /DNA_ORIENTATION=+
MYTSELSISSFTRKKSANADLHQSYQELMVENAEMKLQLREAQEKNEQQAKIISTNISPRVSLKPRCAKTLESQAATSGTFEAMEQHDSHTTGEHNHKQALKTSQAPMNIIPPPQFSPRVILHTSYTAQVDEISNSTCSAQCAFCHENQTLVEELRKQVEHLDACNLLLRQDVVHLTRQLVHLEAAGSEREHQYQDTIGMLQQTIKTHARVHAQAKEEHHLQVSGLHLQIEQGGQLLAQHTESLQQASTRLHLFRTQLLERDEEVKHHQRTIAQGSSDLYSVRQMLRHMTQARDRIAAEHATIDEGLRHARQDLQHKTLQRDEASTLVVQLTQALCLHASVSLPTHHVAASGDGVTSVQHPTVPLGADATDVALASGAQHGTDVALASSAQHGTHTVLAGCQGRNQLLVDYAHEMRHEYAHEMCDALDACPVDAASCLPSSCQPSHLLRACSLDATGVADCAEVEDSGVAHSSYLHLHLSTDACECLIQQLSETVSHALLQRHHHDQARLCLLRHQLVQVQERLRLSESERDPHLPHQEKEKKTEKEREREEGREGETARRGEDEGDNAKCNVNGVGPILHLLLSIVETSEKVSDVLRHKSITHATAAASSAAEGAGGGVAAMARDSVKSTTHVRDGVKSTTHVLATHPYTPHTTPPQPPVPTPACSLAAHAASVHAEAAVIGAGEAQEARRQSQPAAHHRDSMRQLRLAFSELLTQQHASDSKCLGMSLRVKALDAELLEKHLHLLACHDESAENLRLLQHQRAHSASLLTALREAEAKLIDTEAEEERLAMEAVAQGARHHSHTAIERESHKSATRQVAALHEAEVVQVVERETAANALLQDAQLGFPPPPLGSPSLQLLV